MYKSKTYTQPKQFFQKTREKLQKKSFKFSGTMNEQVLCII